MVNEDDKNSVESLSEPESILETVTDLVVPRAIKNNIYKAIGQLTSALIEIPSVYLDGIRKPTKFEHGTKNESNLPM